MYENKLEELVSLGSTAETTEVFGMKITLKVLNAGQRERILEETGHLEPLSRGQALIISTLATSIIAIDNQKLQYVPEDDKEPVTREKLIEQNKKTLSKCQQPVVDYLFSKYEELRTRQEEAIEELKKKSARTGAGGSGRSEKPPASEK